MTRSPRHYCGPSCQASHRRLRPQATRQRGLSAQEWREIGYALAAWFLILVALFYALPILFTAVAS